MKASSGKKKRPQEEVPGLGNGTAYVLTDHQVTSLIMGEVARLQEEILAAVNQYMEEALRDGEHPLRRALREIIRQEVARDRQADQQGNTPLKGDAGLDG